MKNRVGILYGKPVVIGDKNLVTDNEIHLSDLSNSKADGGENNSDGAFTYKSRKVVWRIDDDNEELESILPMIMYLPLYCVSISSDYKIIKYYGLIANAILGEQIGKISVGGNGSISHIEECECNCIVDTPAGTINCNGSLIDFFKEINKINNSDDNVSDEEIIDLLSSVGIKQESYENYINNHGVEKEYGCLTLKN